METPIYDFIEAYRNSHTVRFHMPGHKGYSFLGCEEFDITEIKGADSLYEASGIIQQSEANATQLFGSKKTYYSTEGSSQCIKAMVHLALSQREGKTILAARNVHKSFIYGAACNDAKVEWIYDTNSNSLCECFISPSQLEEELEQHKNVGAVYITSPDYLGNIADVKGLAKVCHKHNVLLLVDNAHGAYLRFLEESKHPMDLGADMCCDSAHKTLPVLTGGAYLHISKNMEIDEDMVRHALSLFGSTSPSYLILTSLDLCNKYLAKTCKEELKNTIEKIDLLKKELIELGWSLRDSDPLRITIDAPKGCTGNDLANQLRDYHIECEFSDIDSLVLMMTPQNSVDDFSRIKEALGKNKREQKQQKVFPVLKSERMMSIRQAVFSSSEMIEVEKSLNRICASPVVACPPAIPVVISGECITQEAIEVMKYYGIDSICVVRG